MSAYTDLSRALPAAAGMERCVISCMMQAPDFAVPEVLRLRVEPDDFGSEAHSLMFDVLRRQWNDGKPIDAEVIMQLCIDRGYMSKIGGPSFISECWTAAPDPQHVEYYVVQVQHKARVRAFLRLCADAERAAFEECEDDTAFRGVMEDMESKLMALRRLGSASRRGIRSGEEVIGGVIDTLIRRNDNKGRPVGSTLGFADLDRRVNGLQRGDVIILGSRPAMGKTALGTICAEHMAVDAVNRKNIPVLMITLEMSDEQVMERSVLGRARISNSKGRSGMFTDAESSCLRVAKKVLLNTRGKPPEERVQAMRFAAMDALEAFCQKKNRAVTQEFFRTSDREIADLATSIVALASGQLSFYDSYGSTVQEIRAQICQWVRRIGWDPESQEMCPPMVIVDYVQLLKPSEKSNRGDLRLTIIEACAMLKGTAKELGIVIMGLAQLTRSSEDNPGKEPAMRDLKESGAFEEYADYVFLLHRESYYFPWEKMKEDKRETWERLAKLRNANAEHKAVGEEDWSDDKDKTAGQKYYEAQARILIRKARHCPTDDVEIFFHAPLVRFASKTAALFSTNIERREQKDAEMEDTEF